MSSSWPDLGIRWPQFEVPDTVAAPLQPRSQTTTDKISPGMIAIIVASGIGGLALIIAFIALAIRCSGCKCCRKGKRISAFKYSNVANEDPITDDFEVLFTDISAKKKTGPQEPVAILKGMVTESDNFGQLSKTVIGTISNIKAYTWDEHKSAVAPNQLMEWAKTGAFSPTIANPLLDDGMLLIIARKFEAEAFWLKVWEQEISTIVDFDSGVKKFWPSADVIREGIFEIVSSLEVQTGTRIIRNIFIRNVSNGQSRSVAIFGFRESAWTKPYTSGFPAAKEEFVSYLGMVIDARQRQDTSGPILILESPLLPIMAFILFAFDAIASRTMPDVHTLLENLPLALDDNDNPVPMSELQINFCCFVVLEDLDRSFSP